jgi:hypothetical protein
MPGAFRARHLLFPRRGLSALEGNGRHPQAQMPGMGNGVCQGPANTPFRPSFSRRIDDNGTQQGKNTMREIAAYQAKMG